MPQKKIFLADDSITIQKVVELTFSEGDYEVHCVSSGAHAVKKIQQIRPDIVLLDVTMPERSGYDICSEITRSPELSGIPVLLLTGALEPFDERRAREAGAKGHLTKPFESRALVTRVEELLESGGGRRPHEPSRPAVQPPEAPRRSESRPVEASPEPPRPAPVPPPARPAAIVASGPADAEPDEVPAEALERAVKKAIQGLSESVIREVAWQVIPDLAEAIIRRRIQELEEEAVARQ